MARAGGIDLGGTKIEARLFDTEAGWTPVASAERVTPREDYQALLDALTDAARWLAGQGADTVGLGAPGLISSDGIALTANLPASGKPFRADLEGRLGRPLPIINDCRAFALSEARLGAGRGMSAVLGLVIGTGLAGGFVMQGTVLEGPNGQAGEYGHTPMPHGVVARHDLPWAVCGCGRVGCYETVCSGKGIERLAERRTGRAIRAADLIEGAPDQAEEILSVWAAVMANLLASLVLSLDPEVIVLGGGVSRLPGVTDRLSSALAPRASCGHPRAEHRPGRGRRPERGAWCRPLRS